MEGNLILHRPWRFSYLLSSIADASGMRSFPSPVSSRISSPELFLTSRGQALYSDVAF